jgi:hypothetical protein
VSAVHRTTSRRRCPLSLPIGAAIGGARQMDSFIAHLAWQDQASTRVKGLYHTCQYHVHVDDLACALHDHYSWYSTTHRICSRIWGTHAQGIPSQLMSTVPK